MTRHNPLKKIILGITGSIAAYKAIDLAKLLQAAGCDVQIVLSHSAPEFVSVMTLESLCPGKVYMADDTLADDGSMLHITLAKCADAILIAPASANCIATLAGGFANCLLSNLCLASTAPIFLAPAMNMYMWQHKIVQRNIGILVEHGVTLLGPASGQQACGDNGPGRMLEPQAIIDHLSFLTTAPILSGTKIVITAGPTREKIDPVRFISNFSSGKMGYALAEAAVAMGAQVTLISGPTALTPPAYTQHVAVETAEEMLEASLHHMQDADIFIGNAAVADYRPPMVPQKIKKQEETLTLTLHKNPDIVASVKQHFPEKMVVGFAAETQNLLEYATSKLQKKGLDMVVANDVSGQNVFGEQENEVHILQPECPPIFISRRNKQAVAIKILEAIHEKLPLLSKHKFASAKA